MMLLSQHTRSVGKREKWGPGPKKNRLAKYRRSGDFGGSRRRSQNVEGGPKQRFDGSPRDSQNFSNAEYMQSCVTTIEPKSIAFWMYAKRPQNHVFS